MPNMSYCRFENTYRDLKDCYDSLEDKPFEELSEREQKYAKKLIELSVKISEELEYLLTD
jgi:hypothetical protein